MQTLCISGEGGFSRFGGEGKLGSFFPSFFDGLGSIVLSHALKITCIKP